MIGSVIYIEYTRNEIEKVINDMIRNKYSTRVQLKSSREIIVIYEKCYRRKSLKEVIPFLKEIINNYDQYHWTPEKIKEYKQLEKKKIKENENEIKKVLDKCYELHFHKGYNMNNKKRGEIEAKIILNKLGYDFDDSYKDDNSSESMPDLKLKNGRFIEVTHTKHNHRIGNFWRLPLDEQCKISDESVKCMETIHKNDIPTEEREYCCNMIKSHFGFDIATGKSSEFKCDIPVLEHSIKNIIREIEEDKGKKHKNKDIDLFIFISVDELQLVKESTSSMKQDLLCSFCRSPFKTMWLCKYEYMDDYVYDIENPDVITFSKNEKPVSVNYSKE